MINEKKHAELRMLILIAPPKLARRAAELFDRGQVPFQYQFHGQGTVSGELLETLGLGSIEKSILMVCLPRCMAAQLLKKLRRELRRGLHRPDDRRQRTVHPPAGGAGAGTQSAG